MVVPRRGGLSKQVQDRLADLCTDEDREQLHKLPWDAFEQADKMLRGKDFRRAPKLHETALALAIVLAQPFRLGDLARLDTEEHFVRDGRGRLTQVALRAAKNAAQIRFEVQPELAARIERHLSKFRPHLRGHAGTTALFPGENGRPRRAGTLGQHLRHLVERQLGKRFHTHLARHLAVDIIAERTDGNLRPAQKLLGHRDVRTTEFIYGSRSTLAANRAYQGILREQSDRVAAKASRKPTPPKPRTHKR
jgi:integrase